MPFKGMFEVLAWRPAVANFYDTSEEETTSVLRAVVGETIAKMVLLWNGIVYTGDMAGGMNVTLLCKHWKILWLLFSIGLAFGQKLLFKVVMESCSAPECKAHVNKLVMRAGKSLEQLLPHPLFH